ncbi:MAG: hypothetical protein ABSG00_11190, partial [Terracidiphilus sp.]
MKFRELLQTAFWSKKTLRRILIGFGILVSVLVVGLGVLYFTAWHWLTPGERNAGRAVLTQIDSLQYSELIRREDFEAREKGLSEKLKTAREAAWTLRDNGVYSELFVYLLITERERAEVWKQNQMQLGDPSITNSDRELNRK